MTQWVRHSWILLVVPLLLFGCGSGDSPFPERSLPQATRSRAPIQFDSQGKARVIIGFKSLPGPAEEGFVQKQGGQVKARFHLVPAIAATLPQKAVMMLEEDPNVAYIEPDGQGQLLADEIPWGVQKVGAPIVQGNGVKGAGVKVAVIDTGIDYRHNDLKANYAGGIDIANNDSDPLDWHGHGTHCAGIIGADDDGTGIVGVAPDVQLYALKVFADGQTTCWWSDVILALQWCVDHKINIASMSIGGDLDSTLEQACNAAYQKGVLLVAAAGNSGGAVMAPACYDSVIAVGATDINNVRTSWSCYGPSLELMAPGLSIKSTLLNNTYGYKSGTSMACPHVTGAAALVRSANPTWSATQVRQQLVSTAQDLGAAGKDNYYGYGLVRADLAVSVTTPPPPPPPPPPPTLTKVEVVPVSTSILEGQTQQFTATAVYSDGSVQDITGQAAWNSSDIKVATIQGAGVALGVGPGTASITAIYQQVPGQATLSVIEPEPSLVEVKVAPASASILKGATQQFTATAVYSDGSTQDVTGQAAWNSRNTAVATVDAGLATGVGAGSATLEAVYEGKTGTASLTVTEPSGDVLQITRAEYIVKRQHLRVFVSYSIPNAVLEVYNADGTLCYGKIPWAGGDLYFLSRVKVKDPGGAVKVIAIQTGTSATKEVTYR